MHCSNSVHVIVCLKMFQRRNVKHLLNDRKRPSSAVLWLPLLWCHQCRKYYHLLLNKVCRVAANRLLKVARIKIPGDILTLSDISNERSFRFKVTNITTFGKLYNETGIASRRPKSLRPPIQNKTRKYHFISNLRPDGVIYCWIIACVKD